MTATVTNPVPFRKDLRRNGPPPQTLSPSSPLRDAIGINAKLRSARIYIGKSTPLSADGRPTLPLSPLESCLLPAPPPLPLSFSTQYQLERSPRSKPIVSFCSEKLLFCCTATVLIFFIAGFPCLLCFEHVDNLKAYRIPSETGLLIPSGYDSSELDPRQRNAGDIAGQRNADSCERPIKKIDLAEHNKTTKHCQPDHEQER
jgi:hypothetical protein